MEAVSSDLPLREDLLRSSDERLVDWVQQRTSSPPIETCNDVGVPNMLHCMQVCVARYASTRGAMLYNQPPSQTSVAAGYNDAATLSHMLVMTMLFYIVLTHVGQT